MAHFSKLGPGNVVIKVTLIVNSVITDVNGIEQEQLGEDFLNQLYNTRDVWKKTSYNTRGGKYYNSDNTLASDQSKAFRKNYGTEGFTYNENIDAFIGPKFYDSWILNETTCLYEAPVTCPNDGRLYIWDELRLEWIRRPGIEV